MDTAADRGPPPLPDADAAEASFLAPFERVFATLKRTASNYATLIVLDARRAAVQFAWVVAGGIFVSVLLVTAWLAIVVALAVWLLGSGMSWPAVLLVAAALNIVGAVIMGMLVRGRFDSAPFAATLRQFRSEPHEAEVKK
jgi:ribose/xylose/arabinose/galactoside ABC-type transport system permease subunit